jgi:predicted PurR-regulated permease PerM
MPYILRFISIYFPPSVIRKITTFVILIGLGFLLQDFLILFFITFLFAYIFLEVGESLSHRIHDWGSQGKKDTPHKIAEKYATTNTIVTILYILFILILVFIFVSILPKISSEIGEFIRQGSNMTRSAQELVSRFETSLDMKLGLDRIVVDIMNTGNIEAFGQAIISHIKNAGIILLKFFLALVLSYLFILERKQIATFLRKIQKGNFSFFYNEGSIIAKKVGKGFGLIFRAQ